MWGNEQQAGHPWPKGSRNRLLEASSRGKVKTGSKRALGLCHHAPPNNIHVQNRPHSGTSYFGLSHKDFDDHSWY